MASDYKSCGNDPKTDNCAMYNQVKCLDCKTGYKIDRNAYLSNLTKLETTQSK